MAQYHQGNTITDDFVLSSSPASSITISRESYDLYCCLLNSAAQSHRSESVLTPFPSTFIKNSKKDYDRLREVLSVMPSCDKVFVEPFCQNGNDITFNYNTDTDLSQLILDLINHIYRNLVNHGLEKKKISQEEIRDVFEFILKKQCNKKFSVHYNMSGTSHMKTGNAFGNGVYLCEDLRVARDFSKGAVISWENSKLGSHLSAVVQCKVIGKKEYAMKTSSNDENRYLIVQNSSDLRIQYVLIFSHFKDENELKRSHNFSRGMIYFYIILLIAVIVGNYWKDIKRELKRLSP
nr:unnamed protein product [Naegleria fowleri]